jgi:hypothetical protein
LVAVVFGGCANNPLFVPAPQNLEAGMQDSQGNIVTSAKGSLTLPIDKETKAEAQAQAKASSQLGVQVPYVQCDDIAVEVDWTIKNLDGSNDGTALVELNGANEFYTYEPSILEIDPGNDDDETPAPDLQGDIPIDVPAGATINGFFTEDETLEASVDLDMITRGNFNPFAATLTHDNRDLQSYQPLTMLMYDMNGDPLPQSPMGKAVPRAAFPHIIRFDITFKPSTHMVLDYDVRVRDVNASMVNENGVPASSSELQQFTNIMLFDPADLGGSGA